MKQEHGCRYVIPGLERGLELLLAFSKQQRNMTFSELHSLLPMPKATAYRTVQTLEYLGFLHRHPNNTFSMGINVMRLGFEYISGLDVVQIGQPVIEQLRDSCHYSSHLAIRDERDVIYVGRVSAAGAKINEVRVGTRLPVHRTSLGRMLLTNINRLEFDQLYPEQHFTGSELGGPETPEQLWELVQQDKIRGYVVGESFYHYGISSIVFPVINRDRRVEAVVSIMVPSVEIPGVERQYLIDEVRLAANKISSFFGATIN